jgi:hypothetical protein
MINITVQTTYYYLILTLWISYLILTIIKDIHMIMLKGGPNKIFSILKRFLFQYCHWVLIVILIKHKRILYYDSNINKEDRSAYYLETTLSWLNDENIKWNLNNFRGSDWNIQLPLMPQQNNGYDCGVFLLAIAEDVFKNNNIATFEQKDIPQIRLKIAISIIES